jgi:intracellular septation protein A
MSQLLDFVPILLFVAVFFAVDIYWATAALMVGVSAQVLIFKLIGKRISRELNMTLWASLIFGGPPKRNWSKMHFLAYSKSLN